MDATINPCNSQKPKGLLFLLASILLQQAAASSEATSATLLRREANGHASAEDMGTSAQEALEILKLGANALLQDDNNGGPGNGNNVNGRMDGVPQSLAEGAETSAKHIVEVERHEDSDSRRKVSAPREVFSQLRREEGENQQELTRQQQMSDTSAFVSNQQELTRQQQMSDASAFVSMRGPPGVRGASGEPGDNGRLGPCGAKGPDGELAQGLAGEKGEQGEPGQRGQRGKRGPPGPPGPRGDKWDSTEESRQMIAFGDEMYARYLELTEFQDKTSSQLLAETNEIVQETGADDAELKAHGHEIILLQQVGEETKKKLQHAKERETYIMKEMPRKLDKIRRVHKWVDRAVHKVERDINATQPLDNESVPPPPPEDKGDTSISGYVKELFGTTLEWTHLKVQHLLQDVYKDVVHSGDDHAHGEDKPSKTKDQRT